MDIFEHLDTIIELLIVAYFLFARARRAQQNDQDDNASEATVNTEEASPAKREEPATQANHALVVGAEDTSTTMRLAPLLEGLRNVDEVVERIGQFRKLNHLEVHQRRIYEACFTAFLRRAEKIKAELTSAEQALEDDAPNMNQPQNSTAEASDVDAKVRNCLGDLAELGRDVDAMSSVMNTILQPTSTVTFPHALKIAEAMSAYFPTQRLRTAPVC